jgi:hypothetical protein
VPTGSYVRTAIRKPKHALGFSHVRVDRTCEACGGHFARLVKNIVRGGGRYCSKKCNPVYAPRSTRSETYRRSNLKRGYGITPEDYQAMHDAQEGVCAICKCPASGKAKQSSRLVVDHNHVTGEVRGLLCLSCNRALGWFRDDREVLLAALQYLEADEDPTLKGDPIP